MAIEALIMAERERYVRAFFDRLGETRHQYRDVAGELLISINLDTMPYPYRYLRADAVYKDEAGATIPVQFDLAPHNSFEPRGFDFGAFVVEADPFAWDKVQFLVDRPPPNEAQIAGWITRWLDIEDTGINAHNQLTGAIHSFSPIETNGEWWYLTGDFGTAPGDAMVEFIELLASQGLTRIVIRSE